MRFLALLSALLLCASPAWAAIPDEVLVGGPAVIKVSGNCPTDYTESRIDTGYCWKLRSSGKVDRDFDGYDLDDCDDTRDWIYKGVYVPNAFDYASATGYKYCGLGGSYGSVVLNATTPLCEATGGGSCYYVHPSGGNDTTGDGSYATPWASFKKVTNYQDTGLRPSGWVDLAPGDVVYLIGTGTYSTTYDPGGGLNDKLLWLRSDQSGSSSYQVTFKRYPGSDICINSGWDRTNEDGQVKLEGASYVTIDDLCVEGGYGVGIILATGSSGTGVVASRNVVRNLLGDGDNNMAGIYTATVGSAHIHHNTVWNAGQADTYATAGGTLANTINVNSTSRFANFVGGSICFYATADSGGPVNDFTCHAVTSMNATSFTFSGNATTWSNGVYVASGNRDNVTSLNSFKDTSATADLVEFNKFGRDDPPSGSLSASGHTINQGGGLRTKHGVTRSATTGASVWRNNVLTHEGLAPSSAEIEIRDNVVYEAGIGIYAWPGGPTFHQDYVWERNLLKGRKPLAARPDNNASATVDSGYGSFIVRYNIGIGTKASYPSDEATIQFLQYGHNNWITYLTTDQTPYGPGDTYEYLSSTSGQALVIDENCWAETGGATFRIDLGGDGSGLGGDYSWASWQAAFSSRFDQNSANNDADLDADNEPTHASCLTYGPDFDGAILDESEAASIPGSGRGAINLRLKGRF